MRTDYMPVIDMLQKHFNGGLRTVVLFGSRARGDESPDSDHDLLLLIDNLPRGPLDRMRIVRGALVDSELRINTVALTTAEFSARLTPLALDICVDGICLYGAALFEPMRKMVLEALRCAGLRRRRFGRDYIWQFDRQPAHDWELEWTGYHELTR